MKAKRPYLAMTLILTLFASSSLWASEEMIIQPSEVVLTADFETSEI